MEHAREFMLRLTQTPIPLVIVCMRAKYPMEEKVKDGKKDWVRSDKLSPKQSDDILSEMFVHGWIDQEHRFHGTKYTLDVLRPIFVDGEPISVGTGKRLAEWASGREKKAATDQPHNGADYITPDQMASLETLCTSEGVPVDSLKKAAGVHALAMIKAGDYERAKTWLDKTISKRREHA
jgi:hypothetical protein